MNEVIPPALALDLRWRAFFGQRYKFLRFIWADAPVLASKINFLDINALARLFGQNLINFVDINALNAYSDKV